MKTPIALTVLLLALLPVSLPGCPCGEGSDEYLCVLLETLTEIAYGTDRSGAVQFQEACPSKMKCVGPTCLHIVENGSFERILQRGALDVYDFPKWSGVSETPSRQVNLSEDGCHGKQSAQLGIPQIGIGRLSPFYQVIDFKALVPDGVSLPFTRLRASASYRAHYTPRSLFDFKLQLVAFAGDPNTIPSYGDARTFGTSDTYRRLRTWEALETVHDSESWNPLYLTTPFSPDSVDFLLVVLEMESNDGNDHGNGILVDRVQVILDSGPYGPIASSDQSTTLMNQPVRIDVLGNDQDWDGMLDLESLQVVVNPSHGTAVANKDGTIVYTPATDFTGTDTFSYIVFDDDGFSGGALVTVEVRPGPNRPPVAVADTVTVPAGETTVLDVRANDFDPDGDTFSLFIVGDPPNGTREITNDSLAVRYTPNDGTTEDFFSYILIDEHGAQSNEATVLITVQGSANNPPEVTDPINNFSVNNDPPESCSFDLDDHFADPDGDALAYSYRRSGNTVTVALSGSVMTVTGTGLGASTVTVTAEDPGGLTARDTFSATGAFATDCAGNRAQR